MCHSWWRSLRGGWKKISMGRLHVGIGAHVWEVRWDVVAEGCIGEQ